MEQRLDCLATTPFPEKLLRPWTPQRGNGHIWNSPASSQMKTNWKPVIYILFLLLSTGIFPTSVSLATCENTAWRLDLDLTPNPLNRKTVTTCTLQMCSFASQSELWKHETDWLLFCNADKTATPCCQKLPPSGRRRSFKCFLGNLNFDLYLAENYF